MNDADPKPQPIGFTKAKVYRDLIPALFDRLSELFPGTMASQLNITHYLLTRDRAIRGGAWMLVYDNDERTGITTINSNARLSDIWPQSKS
jgi:hypothetical protein